MIRIVTGRLPGKQSPGLAGSLAIPASKSHTIRALLVAAFAEGTSRLRRPLPSRDGLAARAAVEFLGARVIDDGEDWIVEGFGSHPIPPASGTINVENSGTTLYLATALAALSDKPVRFDGDQQIRRRSAGPLLDGLRALGARVECEETEGCAPFTVTGPLKAGVLEVDCPVSQYLSALLMSSALIPVGDASPESTGGGEWGEAAEVTRIKVRSLNEAPYVGITLDWLDKQGIRYQRDGWDEFRIPAGQHFRAFDRVVPADWSSATFFLAAAAVTGSSLLLEGLDRDDSQGDKAVVDMLEEMGCEAEWLENGLRFHGKPLKAASHDLNATPDALPAMAVVCCFANGESRLTNVPQARMKETDRIAVMTTELLKLGADVKELPDGMLVRGRHPSPISCESPVIKGAMVDGHDDHRVVMALAVAALGCCGQVSIRGAEAADVTYPGFFKALESVLVRQR